MPTEPDDAIKIENKQDQDQKVNTLPDEKATESPFAKHERRIKFTRAKSYIHMHKM